MNGAVERSPLWAVVLTVVLALGLSGCPQTPEGGQPPAPNASDAPPAMAPSDAGSTPSASGEAPAQ